MLRPALDLGDAFPIFFDHTEICFRPFRSATGKYRDAPVLHSRSVDSPSTICQPVSDGQFRPLSRREPKRSLTRERKCFDLGGTDTPVCALATTFWQRRPARSEE